MKKILTLTAALLMATPNFAWQIFIEANVLNGILVPQINSYVAYGEVTNEGNYLSIVNPNLPYGSLYDMGFSGNEFHLKAYDPHFNLIADKTIEFTLPDGYSRITSAYYANQISSNGEDFYLATVVKDGPSGTKDYAKLVVFDKNGKIAQELGTAEITLNAYTVLYSIDGVYRLLVHEYNLREPINRTHVYYLQGKSGPSSIRLMNMIPSQTAGFNLDGTPAIESQSGVQILLNEKGEAMKILKR